MWNSEFYRNISQHFICLPVAPRCPKNSQRFEIFICDHVTYHRHLVFMSLWVLVLNIFYLLLLIISCLHCDANTYCTQMHSPKKLSTYVKLDCIWQGIVGQCCCLASEFPCFIWHFRFITVTLTSLWVAFRHQHLLSPCTLWKNRHTIVPLRHNCAQGNRNSLTEGPSKIDSYVNSLPEAWSRCFLFFI